VLRYHFDTLSAQVAGQPGPIGTGTLNAHLGQLAERAQSGEKLPIALGGGAEAGRVEDLALLVDDGGYVDVLVGVHPADDNLRFAWHAGTCPPSLNGWDGTTGRDGGQDSHGADQDSYQVTSDRLVRVLGQGPGRQITARAPGQSHDWG